MEAKKSRFNIYLKARLAVLAAYLAISATTVLLVWPRNTQNVIGAAVTWSPPTTLNIQNKSEATWHDIILTLDGDFINTLRHLAPTRGKGRLLNIKEFRHHSYKPLPLKQEKDLFETRKAPPELRNPRHLQIRCREGKHELLLLPEN